MDIKMEIKCLVVYAKCQQQAEYDCDRDAEVYHAKSVRQSLRRINQWADMAEAAIALAEHQAVGADDPSKCDMAYVQQGAKLWRAFMVTRLKAKAATQQ